MIVWLTDKQKDNIKVWGIEYTLNKDKKMYIVDNKNKWLYLIDKANKNFDKKIKNIMKDYTEEEKRSFDIKLKEANKIKEGWQSTFLETLCIEWETVEELANKIITNSNNFQLAYASIEKELRENTKKIKEEYDLD